MKSFIIYRTATKWPRIVITTDEEPVIAELSAKVQSGLDDGRGNAVIEMPYSEYEKADHEKVLLHLESKVGPRTEPTRIVSVDSDGKVISILEHPEPNRFISSRVGDNMTYEINSSAVVGATKQADGTFRNPNFDSGKD